MNTQTIEQAARYVAERLCPSFAAPLWGWSSGGELHGDPVLPPLDWNFASVVIELMRRSGYRWQSRDMWSAEPSCYFVRFFRYDPPNSGTCTSDHGFVSAVIFAAEKALRAEEGNDAN